MWYLLEIVFYRCQKKQKADAAEKTFLCSNQYKLCRQKYRPLVIYRLKTKLNALFLTKKTYETFAKFM
jgi:hypothetical protein